ncbi:MAG: riboflavin kinase [Fibrobacterota bacterium]
MEIITLTPQTRLHEKTLVTIGNFDGIHLGHRMLIERLVSKARLERVASVVVTFEPHTRDVVGDGPVPRLTTQAEKETFLRELNVDYCVVIPFTGEVAALDRDTFITEMLSRQLQFVGLVMGEDHRFGKKNVSSDKKLHIRCEKKHFYTVKLKLYRENDTAAGSTLIRDMILSGNMDSANDMLGHPYLIRAQRVRGKRLGMELGYPTLNFMSPPSQKLVPPPGVYAAELTYESYSLTGCLYFGKCPTFGTREVHFEFFSLDPLVVDPTVGDECSLWVHGRVRGEKRFGSPRELVAQVRRDVAEIKAYFRKG